MVADVVGYSRLMGDDEARTIAELEAMRADFLEPKLAEHGGRLVKTAGDGLLAEFPSAVDAVQCAMEVQGELNLRNARAPEQRRMDFRIGINVGDVMIRGDDLFGDAVNVAARLEGRRYRLVMSPEPRPFMAMHRVVPQTKSRNRAGFFNSTRQFLPIGAAR